METTDAGRVIAGRYRLLRRLGQGGMGSVWSAEHLELKAEVAVKLIVPQQAGDPTVLARFAREARAAAALRGPHVVQILDSGIDEGLAYIVMEQLKGEDLSQRLEREGRLSADSTATIVTHIARAIGRAHEAGLVHRDLKPANVFLVQNDDEITAKVLDFGIAKATDEAFGGMHTDTGAMVGSPFYMSPEQAYGRGDIDFRSDLWSMGIIAFECLVGKPPFHGRAIGEVVMKICSDPLPVPSTLATVPPGFDAWFARAMERDRARRFQSAKELAKELRALLSSDQRPVQSDPPEDAESRAARAATPAPSSSTDSAPLTASLDPTTIGGTSKDGRRQSSRTSRKLWPFVAAPIALAVVAAWGWSAKSRPEPPAVSVASASEPSAPTPASAPLPDAAVIALASTSAEPAPPSSAKLQAASAARTASKRALPKAAPPVASARAPNLLDSRF